VTRIVWAPQAIEDVDAIRAYVARDSPHSAGLLVERLVSAVTRLETHPLSGRVVPEVGDESICEVIHGNYRIIYRLRPDLVEIVTVFHGARLFRLR
jgi:addiction module RelE/StbE family toxin